MPANTAPMARQSDMMPTINSIHSLLTGNKSMFDLIHDDLQHNPAHMGAALQFAVDFERSLQQQRVVLNSWLTAAGFTVT